jgi:hypothetical protein
MSRRILIVVVLPEPFRPRKPTICPRGTVMVSPASAWGVVKTLRLCSNNSDCDVREADASGVRSKAVSVRHTPSRYVGKSVAPFPHPRSPESTAWHLTELTAPLVPGKRYLARGDWRRLECWLRRKIIGGKLSLYDDDQSKLVVHHNARRLVKECRSKGKSHRDSQNHRLRDRCANPEELSTMRYR